MNVRYYRDRVSKKLVEKHVRRYLNRLEQQKNRDLVMFVYQAQNGHWKIGVSERADFLQLQRNPEIGVSELVLTPKAIDYINQKTGSKSIKTITEWAYVEANEKVQMNSLYAINV